MAERRSRGTKKNTYTIYDDHTVGTVQIADEVVATIAALAATETEGVASLAGNITHDRASKIGAKSLARGVKIDVIDNAVSVRMIMNIKYGYNIPEVTLKAQEKVKSAIENMTGLAAPDISISVADITIAKNS